MVTTVKRCLNVVKHSCLEVFCDLVFLVESAAQSHDPKGAASNLLIENEHEGSSQHRLQQLGFQTFKKTQQAIFPIERSKHNSC